MSKRAPRRWVLAAGGPGRRLIVGLAAVLMLAGIGRVAWLAFVPQTVSPAIELQIAPGASARDIAAGLEENGVVRSGRVLRLLARLSSADRDFHHGVHHFEGDITPLAVLAELTTPSRDTVRVTIPEGLRVAQAAHLLEEAGVLEADEYVKAACESDFLAVTGAPAESNCSEGYLFPDTYYLSPGMAAADIVRLQHRRLLAVLKDLGISDDGSVGFTGSSPAIADTLQLLTLASIIQKESYQTDEQPLVASVFHNRLERDMKLQADPTVIYGILASGRQWDGDIRRSDLREDTPYNSYVHRGLPPGPICSPGKGALSAALNPATSDFLFFVADGKGTHRFSRTVAEHQAAVRQYLAQR